MFGKPPKRIGVAINVPQTIQNTRDPSRVIAGPMCGFSKVLSFMGFPHLDDGTDPSLHATPIRSFRSKNPQILSINSISLSTTFTLRESATIHTTS